ncbi:hypothetical protein A1O1_04807 [Capronia coronata CBS 617.96]|uniref:Oxidoreductase n=1 Tax=Capronia coronata CBS 617.96 TaxID=1182541 RepID=W9YE15_9EURO|nr:uncharacterized protein A1O1_04807 [Capronia coronata CBS 617.96]EXJ87880.1 hypothetical protein A1O1_04807 [Capronia coronata CBS 617.96]
MADTKPSSGKRTVLVTGCSDGGCGAALAIAFHKAGLHVYATARNPAKMKEVQSHGIETLTLDVVSESSIAACVARLPQLDILVNNAGALYSMPISDLSIPRAKQLFDLNVWSFLAMTQAFLPLLLKSKGMIVNHTSSASVLTIPFQATYNASKAAMAMYSDTMRLELAPFGIRVVELKSTSVASNGFKNQQDVATLPKGSIYEPAREVVERTLCGDFAAVEVTADQWAAEVVHDLLKPTPPQTIWRGTKAGMAKWAHYLVPASLLESMMVKMTGMDVVARLVQG